MIREVNETIVEPVNPTTATATNVNTSKEQLVPDKRPPGQNPDANEFSPKRQLFTNSQSQNKMRNQQMKRRRKPKNQMKR